MTAAPASDAEALSCATAARYAGRWARSVARPVDDDRPDPPSPWFIDGFAGADLQRAALRGATVQPAAMLAVQALDDAIGARARVVLIEEDPGLIVRLREMLEGIGAGDRIRASSDPATAEPGEILLVESTFASHAHRLAQRIGDEAALLRLAPLAARALPWTALEPVARLASADVLLRFPREDFEKQARFTGPLADLPPHLRRVVEGCSSFLGDARHGWLMAWREAQRSAGPDAALATAIARMQALLAGEDRLTPILHVGGKTESVHLLLSSPHPGHPSELEAALADGAAKPKPPPKRKSAASARTSAAEPAAPVEEPSPEPATPAAAELSPAQPQAARTEPVAARSAEPAAAPPPPDASPASDELLPVDVPAAALDLFASAEDPEPTPRGPGLAEPRPSVPRPRKPRPPAPELLGLFDDTPED